ncbi:uncharacterized protein LOC142337654 isoform X2 [Convolutriloba macropyga]|uniref:uncharacterized protein LOC142337654 isoform X2 n=1 Tax=Convolutriloba macropyga TaxID=536237 RepID=UPI003F522326
MNSSNNSSVPSYNSPSGSSSSSGNSISSSKRDEQPPSSSSSSRTPNQSASSFSASSKHTHSQSKTPTKYQNTSNSSRHLNSPDFSGNSSLSSHHKLSDVSGRGTVGSGVSGLTTPSKSDSKSSSLATGVKQSSSGLKRKYPSSLTSNESSSSDNEAQTSNTTPSAGATKSGRRSITSSPNPYSGGSAGPASPQTSLTTGQSSGGGNSSSAINISTAPISERQQLALLMKQYGASSPSSTNSAFTDHPEHSNSSTSAISPAGVSLQSTAASSTSHFASGSLLGSTPTPPNRKGGLYKRNQMGETPLHLAAKKGDLEKVRRLVELGADVNATDHAGWTPLHEACFKNHPEVAIHLLTHGADVHAQGGDDGDTPLHDSCANRYYDVTLLLLKHGADPRRVNRPKQNPNHGESALSLAKEDKDLSGLLNMDAGNWRKLAFRDPALSHLCDSGTTHSMGGSRGGTDDGIKMDVEKDAETVHQSDQKEHSSSSKIGNDPSTISAGNLVDCSDSKADTAAQSPFSASSAAQEASRSSSSEETSKSKDLNEMSSGSKAVSGSKSTTSAASDLELSSSIEILQKSSSENLVESSAYNSSEDEFANSPGELFIDEDLEDSPKKPHLSSTNQNQAQLSTAIADRVSSENRAGKVDSSGCKPSSEMKPPAYSGTSLTGSAGNPKSFESTEVLMKKVEKLSAAQSSFGPSGTASQNPGSDKMHNRVGGSNSSISVTSGSGTKVSPPFPNVITPEGELLKKKKKKDKHKEKDKKENSGKGIHKDCELSSSSSGKHESLSTSKEKMAKKKRKHESRSNSEESLNSNQGSRKAELSSDSASEKTASNSSLDKIEHSKPILGAGSSVASATVKKPQQQQPQSAMKPLKVDIKSKPPVIVKGKGDDDRLFKPDPVVKSPKLSPKLHEKSFNVSLKAKASQPQSSAPVSVDKQLLEKQQHQKVVSDKAAPEKKREKLDDHSISEPKIRDLASIKEFKESSKSIEKPMLTDHKPYHQGASEHHGTSLQNTNLVSNLTGFGINSSQKGSQALTQVSPLSGSLTVTCGAGDSGFSSKSEHGDIFKTSPVVRLTIEPKLEAKSSEQFSPKQRFKAQIQVPPREGNEKQVFESESVKTEKSEVKVVHSKVSPTVIASERPAKPPVSAEEPHRALPKSNQHDSEVHEVLPIIPKLVDKIPKIMLGDRLTSISSDERSTTSSICGDDVLFNVLDNNLKQMADVKKQKERSPISIERKIDAITTREPLTKSDDFAAAPETSTLLAKSDMKSKIERGSFGIATEKIIPNWSSKLSPTLQTATTNLQIVSPSNEIIQPNTAAAPIQNKLNDGNNADGPKLAVEVKSTPAIKFNSEASPSKADVQIKSESVNEPQTSTGGSTSIGQDMNQSGSKDERPQFVQHDLKMEEELKMEPLDEQPMDVCESGSANMEENAICSSTVILTSNADQIEADEQTEAQRIDDEMTSTTQIEAPSTPGRGAGPRRRKKPLKFADGAESVVDFVATNSAGSGMVVGSVATGVSGGGGGGSGERGRPPKRAIGAGGVTQKQPETDKQTRRKGRTCTEVSTTEARREDDSSIKTRTGTRNSTKATLSMKAEKSSRAERSQASLSTSSGSGSANGDQPPIILKISTSQFRTASPTRSSHLCNSGGDIIDANESSNSMTLTERSSTPVKSEIGDEGDCGKGGLKSDRTPRVTRTLRSNAHLKRDLTSGDANFLHNEDSNSSSCSNDSGTRKQNSLRSSNNSSTFAELKEESVSNVGSRAQTPTFGQQSSNENPNDVGCKEPPLIAKIEVKAAIDEQELINTTEVKVESSSNGLTTTKREPIEEPQQDTNPPVAPSATNNSNNGVNMNQSTSGAAPSSVVPTAGPMISVLPPPVANEPPQHPKRRKLAKHKAELEAKSNSILEVPPIAPPDEKFTNPIYTYLHLKKNIREKQLANLPPVPPKVQPFYEEFYCVKKHYLIEGHKNNYPKLRLASNRLEQFQELKMLFDKQERERNKLRAQQLIERERLKLVCEAETMRIYTRSALAERNQPSNLSVCQILAEDDFYNVAADMSSALSLQTGADTARACSSRGRHNLRQFQSWISDNNEKLDRLKSHMLKRHDHESHALRASQALEWSYKVRNSEVSISPNVARELSEANFVPKVELAQDVAVVPF